MLKLWLFCHSQENLEINIVKNRKDTATKTEIDASKTAYKRAVQKTAEATGYLIRNKIADKITSVGRTKSKKKEEIYKPAERRQQMIYELQLF